MIEFARMKAPGDRRPTWRGGIIQIHITRVCNLHCTHCTQGSNFGGKPVVMSLDNFEQACKSLKDYYGVVGVFGGNPTMHPQFPAICEILANYFPKEQRGLWSNDLRGHGKLCRDIFNPDVSNLNVHCVDAAYDEMKRDWPECNPIGQYDSSHSPVYVAMDDLPELTQEQKWEMINNCDINQYWSAILCETKFGLRAFFCEIAGAQAMLMESNNDTGLFPNIGWWKLPITAFEDQIRSHCFKCGVPLKAKGDLAVTGTKEFISKTYISIAKLKNKEKEVIIVDSLNQLGGKVDRATDYIANGLEPKQDMNVFFPNY